MKLKEFLEIVASHLTSGAITPDSEIHGISTLENTPDGHLKIGTAKVAETSGTESTSSGNPHPDTSAANAELAASRTAPKKPRARKAKNK